MNAMYSSDELEMKKSLNVHPEQQPLWLSPQASVVVSWRRRPPARRAAQPLVVGVWRQSFSTEATKCKHERRSINSDLGASCLNQMNDTSLMVLFPPPDPPPLRPPPPTEPTCSAWLIAGGCVLEAACSAYSYPLCWI